MAVELLDTDIEAGISRALEGNGQLEPGARLLGCIRQPLQHELTRQTAAIRDLNDRFRKRDSSIPGKILITGDVSRILSLTPPTDAEQVQLASEVGARLAAITAD